jgi:protein gp37
MLEKCPYCSKQRSPREFIRMSVGGICQECWQRHLAALDALSSGKYTGECSECGKSVDEIGRIQGDVDGVSMAIHFENGIYRPLCKACDRVYVTKRSDLYANTRFWKELQL